MKVVSERWVMGTCGLPAASAAAAALASLLASCFQGLASTSSLACSSSCNTGAQAQTWRQGPELLKRNGPVPQGEFCWRVACVILSAWAVTCKSSKC